MKKKSLIIIFLFIIWTSHIHTTISKFLTDCIPFAIGSALPFYVAIFGTDLIANLTNKTPAPQQALDIIQETLGQNRQMFEKVYVGNKDMVFGGYVPNHKTVIFGPQFVDNLINYNHPLDRAVIRHEYCHAIRYSTEKIRLLCLIVPFITYKIMELVINKCTGKYGHNKIFSKYIAKIPSWVKSIIIGLSLCLINQHLITAYARYEEYMTDRTADKIFGGRHNCCYSLTPYHNNKIDFILELTKKFFLPAFFWHHPTINNVYDLVFLV